MEAALAAEVEEIGVERSVSLFVLPQQVEHFYALAPTDLERFVHLRGELVAAHLAVARKKEVGFDDAVGRLLAVGRAIAAKDAEAFFARSNM